MTQHLLLAALLGLAPGIAPGQGTSRSLSLADGEKTWSAVRSGAASVSWAAGEVVLSPGGSHAGVAAQLDPPPEGLLAVELTATPQAETQLVVQLTRAQDAVPVGPAWTTTLSGSKPHKLAALLAPPAADGAPVFLHIGARGQTAVTVGGLSLADESVPPPLDTSKAAAPLPDDWQPDGVLDAQAHEIAGATELQVEVSGIRFSVVPTGEGPLGGFPPLSALVTARGTGNRMLRITGEFPAGGICDDREYPITKAGISRAPLRLQGLLPGTHVGRLTVSSGRDAASLPITLTVGPGYPAFGVTVAESPSRYRWQLQEIVVEASPDSSLEALLAQVGPHLAGPPAMRALYFAGLPETEVLRKFVGELKGKVNLYSAAWRPHRPLTESDPQAEAERLLAAARELHSAVRTSDLDAYCISPVFDHLVLTQGSPENRLLDACFRESMDQYFGCVVVASPPLPAGGVVGEAVNGRNRREGSSFWTDLDTSHYPYEVERLMDEHDAHAPILTQGITGPAGTDERLDGLKVAKALAVAAYAGATGATFPEATPGSIALTRPDGSLSPAGLAVRELSRELASAAPVRRSWESAEIPGQLGDGIVALPFVRESADEVILVLWNNTSVARPITLTLRQVPYSEHVLTLSARDPVIDRAYQGHFKFAPQALKLNRQEVYLRLAPLEVKVIRHRLRVALSTWVESITFTPPPKGGSGKIEHDDRPWWKKLQDWAEGNE